MRNHSIAGDIVLLSFTSPTTGSAMRPSPKSAVETVKQIDGASPVRHFSFQRLPDDSNRLNLRVVRRSPAYRRHANTSRSSSKKPAHTSSQVKVAIEIQQSEIGIDAPTAL